MKTLLILVVVFSTAFADELTKFNDLRRGFAAANGIPNMWALKYSKKLLDIANSIPCPTKPGADWRYFYTNGGENGKELEKYLFGKVQLMEKAKDPSLPVMIKEWEKGTAYFLEYVNPIQTKLACVDKRCPFESEDLNLVIDYRRLCLFGSNNNLGITLPINEKDKKVPASECGPSGKSENKLCVPK